MCNAFVILRMVATARYLHLKSQELHEALMEAYGTLGEDADERVRLREEGPAIEANAQRVVLLTDQHVQPASRGPGCCHFQC